MVNNFFFLNLNERKRKKKIKAECVNGIRCSVVHVVASVKNVCFSPTELRVYTHTANNALMRVCLSLKECKYENLYCVNLKSFIFISSRKLFKIIHITVYFKMCVRTDDGLIHSLSFSMTAYPFQYVEHKMLFCRRQRYCSTRYYDTQIQINNRVRRNFPHSQNNNNSRAAEQKNKNKKKKLKTYKTHTQRSMYGSVRCYTYSEKVVRCTQRPTG